MAGDTTPAASLVRLVRPGPHPVDHTPWTRDDQHKHQSWSAWSTRGPEKSWSTTPLTCGSSSLVRLVLPTAGARAYACARTRDPDPAHRTKIGNQKIGAELHIPTKWDPNIGQRIGPAWRAVAANLRHREWGSRSVAVQIALTASDIKRSTAKSLISDAIRNGYLEKRTQKDHRGRPYQQIRLTTTAPMTQPRQAGATAAPTARAGDAG